MKQSIWFILLLSISLPLLHGQSFFGKLSTSVETAISEMEEISDERKAQLAELATIVSEESDSDRTLGILFVCTHNSRRSQMAQAWAMVAAQHYSVEGLNFYSGGTEATAFNPRAVSALKRAGFKINNISDLGDSNPYYKLRTGKGYPPQIYFSKKYGHELNPQENFVAVMVCSDADEACPLVDGADARVAITYIDPKVSDGTDAEAATYTERSQQIAREMFYFMDQLRQLSQ